MPSRHAIEPLSKQVTIIIGLTVVGFMAFGLTLSFYRNILFERTLADLEDQNKEIARGIAEGYGEVDYFRSEQYKDKYAKENLGKLNPGEKILIITQNPGQAAPAEETPEEAAARREAAYQEMLRQMPTWEHWKLYLWYPERLEELKRGV
jgi:cell division protein FtsB